MIDILLTDMKNKIQYKLKSNSRITIIRGNSATGKSLFVKCIDMQKNFAQISIKSDRELRHINTETILDQKELREDLIYVMDEFDGLNDKRISKYINNIKYTFILITRDVKLPHLIYNISDIYEFIESKHFNILKPKYDINKFNKYKECIKINKLQTEDSGSGLKFYKNLKNYKVETSNGNSNINRNLKDNQFSVVDSIAFGPYIKEYLIKTRYLNNILIFPKSFEYLLLTSDIFKEKYIETSYREKDYYKELVKIANKYGIKYNKKDLDTWFLEDKQFNKIIKKIEEEFSINLINKFKNEEISMDWSF